MGKRVVLLVLVFALVLNISFVFAQKPAVTPPPSKGQVIKEKIDKIKVRVDELTQQLRLTVVQQKKIREILVKASEDAKAVVKEARRKARTIQTQAEADIQNVLTPVQKKKLENLSKKPQPSPVVVKK